jgi:hypothetical protein
MSAIMSADNTRTQQQQQRQYGLARTVTSYGETGGGTQPGDTGCMPQNGTTAQVMCGYPTRRGRLLDGALILLHTFLNRV